MLVLGKISLFKRADLLYPILERSFGWVLRTLLSKSRSKIWKKNCVFIYDSRFFQRRLMVCIGWVVKINWAFIKVTSFWYKALLVWNWQQNRNVLVEFIFILGFQKKNTGNNLSLHKLIHLASFAEFCGLVHTGTMRSTLPDFHR